MCYGTMDLASSLYGHVLLQFPPRNHSDVPRDVSETKVIETKRKGLIVNRARQSKTRQDKTNIRLGVEKNGPMTVDVYSKPEDSAKPVGTKVS